MWLHNLKLQFWHCSGSSRAQSQEQNTSLSLLIRFPKPSSERHAELRDRPIFLRANIQLENGLPVNHQNRTNVPPSWLKLKNPADWRRRCRCHCFILPAMRNLSGTCRRIQGQCGILSCPKLPLTSSAKQSQSVVDSLCGPCCQSHGEKIPLSFPLTLPGLWPMNSRNQRAFFAGLIATSSNSTAGGAAQLTPSGNRCCNSPVIKAMAQQPSRFLSPWRMGAITIGRMRY